MGKLSKRKKRGEGGEELLTFIREYREAGYLPEAMFNFLAGMGWACSPDTDLFTRQGAIDKFDLADINPATGALPLSKLEWMNGHYIRGLDPEDLAERLLPFLAESLGQPVESLWRNPALPVLVPLIQERLKTLDEAAALIDFAFVDEISYDPQMLVAKGLTPAQSLATLQAAGSLLAERPSPKRGWTRRSAVWPTGWASRWGSFSASSQRGDHRGKASHRRFSAAWIALGRERTLAHYTQGEELLRRM